MAAHLVNRDFKIQRMLSNEDIVLLLIGITKQFHKDPQSPWSPTAFVAVLEGVGSSFLGRGAGAAWVVMGRGQGASLESSQEQAVPPGGLVLGKKGKTLRPALHPDRAEALGFVPYVPDSTQTGTGIPHPQWMHCSTREQGF